MDFQLNIGDRTKESVTYSYQIYEIVVPNTTIRLIESVFFAHKS